MPSLITQLVEKVAGRLRFPQLFWAVLALFLIDLVFPDPVPFADEILFGLLTVLLGSLRKEAPVTEREQVEVREVKDVTPRE